MIVRYVERNLEGLKNFFQAYRFSPLYSKLVVNAANAKWATFSNLWSFFVVQMQEKREKGKKDSL